MKIKKIELFNNAILGNINISFEKDSKIEDVIILAGENGCGKTTLLNIIYNFVSGECTRNYNICEEINKITVEFLDSEIQNFKNDSDTKDIFSGCIGNEITFIMDYSEKNCGKFSIEYVDGKIIKKNMHGMLGWNSTRNIIKTIFSTAEINFTSKPIGGVTSKDLDLDFSSMKQSVDLGTEIAQLLVDIKALDDSDLADWVNNNPELVPPDNVKEIRIKRFKDAFKYMFDGKKFKGIKNGNNCKEIIFEENGKEMYIENLSSGEKQIVFRGGFLLKNADKSNGSIILIDEPELSLHPRWQIKILEFFRRMFNDNDGKAVAQIFISTHSPFILHNDNRKNDKVIVLKKNENGNVDVVSKPKYYLCSTEAVIKDAFQIDSFTKLINTNKDKTLIITEGKTDWKHLKNAYEKLMEKQLIDYINIEFLEYEDTLGDSRLHQLIENLSMISRSNKIICIFDRDIKSTVTAHINGYKKYENGVYSMIIPVPKHRETTQEMSIEHLYIDHDIKRENDGKRLYIGNEFSQISGIHIENNNIFCKKKDKCGETSYKILDSDSFIARVDNENLNIAMSKNVFVNNIVNSSDGFEEIDYSGFIELFKIINEIDKS